MSERKPTARLARKKAAANVQEIREIMNSTSEDIREKPYEPTRSPARRRRARVVTGEDC
jgi:hypothetical protein